MRLLTKMMNKEEIEQKTIELPHGIFEKGSTKNNFKKSCADLGAFLLVFYIVEG